MEALRLRPATPADSAHLLAWRNDPATRAASRSTSPVGAEEHERWLAAVLGDPARDLLIVQREGDRVGQVRFDALGAGVFEISVGLDAGARGAGLGTRTIAAGLAWLWRERPAARRVVAAVRADNEASLRAFARAGFADGGTAAEPGFRRFVAERP